MANATVHTAGDFTQLQSALAAAQDGDEIQLTADITYPTYNKNNPTSTLVVAKSITIDGQNKNISGYGLRSPSALTTLAISGSSSNNVSVVLKDLTIRNAAASGRPIETRGNIASLTLDNVKVYATGSGNPQGLTIGGYQATTANVVMTNSEIKLSYTNSGVTKPSGYCVISFNPYHLVATNSTFDGWAALYFKGISSSTGSNGTVVEATNCTFNCINKNTGKSDTFGAFALEDGGINITLDNCVVDARYTDPNKVARQSMFLLSPWKTYQDNHTTAPCSLTIKGANSRVIGDFIDYGWDNEATPVPVTFELQGGSYYANDFETGVASGWVYINGDKYVAVKMENDGEPIYRISLIPAANINNADSENPIVTFYGINDNVENLGAGTNPTTAFAVMEGDTVEMVNNNTVADYVLVASPTTEDQTILKVGKNDGEEKVNQTLVVNSGLDVQNDAQVIVQPGSTLQIGAGGIVTENTESIIVEADEEGAASLLLDPTITVNNTPNLTVKMTAKHIGRNADNDYFWHRFAMPVASITSWDKEGGLGDGNENYPTYLYAWDYTNNAWENIAPNAMEPMKGYTLTLASEYIDGSAPDGHLNVLQDVTYIFKGNLVGNTDQPLNFQHEGFNFFGNSYTGYMDVKTMLQGLEDGHIDGTAYMWNTDEQIYVGVSLLKLIKGRGLENWQKEVAPMQTFILRLRGADTANEEVNYAAAIWGNPNRYGNNSGSGAGAPRRRVADINEDTYMEIAVKAANGKSSIVDFTEAVNNSDAFESGYDVEKYMNEKTINLYATVNGMNLSSVVTDNIEGKTLSLQTNGEIAYTMSFKNVEGEEYAIRDNATGAIIAIEEGATYEFAAQPNSTIEGRFEIVSRADAPTAIENTEVKANVKGIYTILGQYLGENFDILPAGVYVVDGVKIVK